jgi:transcriptional regulator with XRE-family HTH domain
MKPKQIITLRKKLGLTQSELARKLGVNRAAVCQWEHGTQTPLEMASKFMRLLEGLHDQEIDYEILIGTKEDANNEQNPKSKKERKP